MPICLLSVRCLIPVLAVRIICYTYFLPSLLFTPLQQCFTLSYTAVYQVLLFIFISTSLQYSTLATHIFYVLTAVPYVV